MLALFPIFIAVSLAVTAPAVSAVSLVVAAVPAAASVAAGAVPVESDAATVVGGGVA